MKYLNIVLTDEEFERLVKKKKLTGDNWRNYLLGLAGVKDAQTNS